MRLDCWGFCLAGMIMQGTSPPGVRISGRDRQWVLAWRCDGQVWSLLCPGTGALRNFGVCLDEARLALIAGIFALIGGLRKASHADAMRDIETSDILGSRQRGNAAVWRLCPALVGRRFSSTNSGTPMAKIILLGGRDLVTMCTPPGGIYHRFWKVKWGGDGGILI